MGGNPGATAPAGNFLPHSSIVTGENFSYGDFVTVVRKKSVSSSPVNSPAITSITKKWRISLIGVRRSSSLSVVQKRVCRKFLFVSQISLEVTTTDLEKSLNDQLQLASLAGTRLKSKYLHVHL
jgi:hypothetical protein